MAGEEKIFSEIQKRDGRIVPFEMGKITQAIFAAARAVGGEDYALADQITGEVVRFLTARKLPGVIPTVEEIQDAVEKVLIERGHARTAKAYILYRASRTRIREARSELMDVVRDILLEDSKAEAGEKNRQSPAEKMHHIALAASKKYYLDNLLPAEIAKAHLQGSLHIHQLAYYSKTLDSLQLDLYPLLLIGCGITKRTVSVDFLEKMLTVLLIIRRCHNDLAGELALPGFDTIMGKLLRSEGKEPDHPQSAHMIKTLLNYLQAPNGFGEGFLNCSIAFGLDTSEEGLAVSHMILTCLAEKALPPHNKPPFIFMLKRGVNMMGADPGYPLYQLALRASLRGANLAICLLDSSVKYPAEQEFGYFSNGLCIGANRRGAAGGIRRGNIASLTINLPRLAILSENEELFFIELDRLLRLAVRQLLHRFEVLTALQCQDLPFVMGSHLYRGSENLALEDSVKESLEQGQMTLCFCGLREATSFLSKGQNGLKEDPKGLHLLILEHMARRVNSFSEEYDLNIALCGAVPGIIARRFVRKDREEFGVIKGVTDREFYNNGFLLFLEDEGLAHKLEFEGELHRYCKAGYSSKTILFSGLEPDAMISFIERLSAAGIKFIHPTGGRDTYFS